MIATTVVVCCAAREFRRQGRADANQSARDQRLLPRPGAVILKGDRDWSRQNAIPGTAPQPRGAYAAGAGGLKSGNRVSNAAFRNLKWDIVAASSVRRRCPLEISLLNKVW